MKAIIRPLLAALLIAGAPAALAADLMLDPQANQVGDIVRTVCTSSGLGGTALCPQDGGSLTLEDDLTLQILSTGFFNSIADVQLVPSDQGFFFSSFSYQLQEMGGPMIASANGVGVDSQPSNAPLTAVATYHIIVDWTLQGVAGGATLDSAAYTIHVTTSAQPIDIATAVPEPATPLLLIVGMLGGAMLQRRRAR